MSRRIASTVSPKASASLVSVSRWPARSEPAGTLTESIRCPRRYFEATSSTSIFLTAANSSRSASSCCRPLTVDRSSVSVGSRWSVRSRVRRIWSPRSIPRTLTPSRRRSCASRIVRPTSCDFSPRRASNRSILAAEIRSSVSAVDSSSRLCQARSCSKRSRRPSVSSSSPAASTNSVPGARSSSPARRTATTLRPRARPRRLSASVWPSSGEPAGTIRLPSTLSSSYTSCRSSSAACLRGSRSGRR